MIKKTMPIVRSFRLVAVALLLLSSIGSARADKAPKPPKIPVVFGTWTGPSAGTFKSAVRKGIAKDCIVVAKKKARVVIEGTAEAQGKGAVVHVRVKAAKTDEIVETKDFTFARLSVSSGQAGKMGKAVAEIAGRSPELDAPPAP